MMTSLHIYTVFAPYWLLMPVSPYYSNGTSIKSLTTAGDATWSSCWPTHKTPWPQGKWKVRIPAEVLSQCKVCFHKPKLIQRSVMPRSCPVVTWLTKGRFSHNTSIRMWQIDIPLSTHLSVVNWEVERAYQLSTDSMSIVHTVSPCSNNFSPYITWFWHEICFKTDFVDFNKWIVLSGVWFTTETSHIFLRKTPHH